METALTFSNIYAPPLSEHLTSTDAGSIHAS